MNEDKTVQEACALVDRTLGEGVVTPDHVFYVCTGGVCPATEPEEVPANAPPDPGVSTEPCDGSGVNVSVLDSGWLPGADGAALLAGRRHRRDRRTRSAATRPASFPIRATGPLWPACVRTMAPKADVRVRQTFRKVGATTSLTWSSRYPRRSRAGAEIISLDFGSNTRSDIASLGFDVVGERLRNYPGVALVAAAGNDASRRPFWPAAFPWAVGVGASAPTGAAGRTSATTGAGWTSSRRARD